MKKLSQTFEKDGKQITLEGSIYDTEPYDEWDNWNTEMNFYSQCLNWSLAGWKKV